MEKNKNMQNVFKNLWPDISDGASARKAAMAGFWAAVIVAVLTGLLSILGSMGYSVLGLDLWALLDAAIFVAVAAGIFYMSRIAAVAGLFIYIAERIYMIATFGEQAINTSSGFVTILLILAFVNGIRGTFAYQKYRKG